VVDDEHTYEARNLLQRHRSAAASLSLWEAHIAARTSLHVLRDTMRAIEPELGREIGSDVRVTLVVFGSLGRMEFVPALSDVDPIIVWDAPRDEPTMAARLREGLIGRLARAHSWLQIDDRATFLTAGWDAVKNVHMKFPVFNRAELLATTPEAEKRRWQIMFESRPLVGASFYYELFGEVCAAQSDSEPTDFSRLAQKSLSYFSHFEEPEMYKDAVKYFKATLFRDFYKFANITNLALGWRAQFSESVDLLRHLRAPSLVKIWRLVQLADAAEQSAVTGAPSAALAALLNDAASATADDSLAQIAPPPAYRDEAAQLLYRLIVRLVYRFTQCWEEMYLPATRNALRGIRGIKLDAVFPTTIDDAAAEQKIEQLLDLRRKYLAEMRNLSRVLAEYFFVGTNWAVSHEIPRAFANSIAPFARYGDAV
jgi:predicted nucleotidyltransferase